MEDQENLPEIAPPVQKKPRVKRVNRYVNSDKVLIITRRESDDGDFVPAAEIYLKLLSPDILTQGFEYGMLSKITDISRGKDCNELQEIFTRFANSVEDGTWPEVRTQNTFKFTREELEERLTAMTPEEAGNTVVALRRGLGIDV